jgi:hypothetical protein
MKFKMLVVVLLCLFVLPNVSFAISSGIGTGQSYTTLSEDSTLGYIVEKPERNHMPWLSDHFTDTGRPTGRFHRPPHCPPVTPTPIPAAAWLLGTGLVGLFGIRRRLQK